MLSTAANTPRVQRTPALLGQTVVVIGDGAGIGLATARRARAEGAEVIVRGRDPERLARAAVRVGARRTAALDVRDPVAMERFFDELPGPVDHVVVTAADRALALEVARHAADRIRPGGTLVFLGGIGPQFTAALAVALAPVRVRVNLIDPGPIDTPVPATRLDDLVVERSGSADDIAARAVQVMADTALTGVTSAIEGVLQPLPHGR